MESWNEYSANKEMFTYDGTFKKILPTAASSKIVGRKISTSQALKVSQQQKIKPKIIDINKMTKTKLHEGIRSESISPSPLKSTTKKLKANKIPKTNLSSPLNMLSINKDKAKKKEIEIKTDKHKTIKNKKFIFEPALQSSNLKVDSLVKPIEEKNLNNNKRSKSKKALRKSIIGNKDKDIIQVKIPSEVRQKDKGTISSHIETVERLKTEPDPMQRSLRSRLSQELLKSSKIPDKKLIKDPKDPKPLKTKKSGTIQAYIKEKKRKQFIEKINKKLEEDFRERERISTLEQLEKRPKVLKPKKAPKKQLFDNDYDKSKFQATKYRKKHKRGYDSKPKTIDLKNSAYQSHDKLMQFLNPKSTKNSIFSRSSSQDFPSSSESCVSDLCTDRGEWINLLESKYSGTNSQFVEDFKARMMKSQEEFEYKTRTCGILDDEENDYEEDEEKIKTVIEIEELSSESYDFRDQKLESKELKLNHKVPPLTLSLLKNEDSDSNIDEDQESYTDRDDFIKETKMMEDSNFMENESDNEYDEVGSGNEDYLDSDSDVGTPWVIDNKKGKNEKDMILEEKIRNLSEEGGVYMKNKQGDDKNKLKMYGEVCGIEYDDGFSYKLSLNEQKVNKIEPLGKKEEKIVVKDCKDFGIGMMGKGKTGENEDFKKNDQAKHIVKSNARTKSLEISEENDFNAKMLDFLIKLHDPTEKIPEVRSKNKEIRNQTQCKDKDLVEKPKISPHGLIIIESKALNPIEKQFSSTKDQVSVPDKIPTFISETEKTKEIKPYIGSNEKYQGSKNLLAKNDNSKGDIYNHPDKPEETKKDLGFFNIEKLQETKSFSLTMNEKGQDFKGMNSNFGENVGSKLEQTAKQGNDTFIKPDPLPSPEKPQESKKFVLQSSDNTQEAKEFSMLNLEKKQQDPKIVTVPNLEKSQEPMQILIPNREKTQEPKQVLIPSPEKTKEPKPIFIPSPEKTQEPSGLNSSPGKIRDPKRLTSSPKKTRQLSPPSSQAQSSKLNTLPITMSLENPIHNTEKPQEQKFQPPTYKSLEPDSLKLPINSQDLQKNPLNLIEKPLETKKLPSLSQTTTTEKTQDPKPDRISPSKVALADLKKTPTSYTKKLQALKLCSNLYSEDLSESSSDSKPSAKFYSDKKPQESPKNYTQIPNDILKKQNPSPQTEELKSKISKETEGKSMSMPEKIDLPKQSPRGANKAKGILETYPKASPRPSPRPSPRMSPRMSPRIAPVNIEKACLRFDSSEVLSPSIKTAPVVAKIIENAKIYEKIKPKKPTESKNLLKLPEIIEKKSTEQGKDIEKDKKEKSVYSLFPENIDKFLDCPENIEKILENTPSYTKISSDSLEKHPDPRAKSHKILTNLPISSSSDDSPSNSVDPSPVSTDTITKTTELLTEAADILSKCTKNSKSYGPLYKTTDDSPDILSEKDEPFNFIALIEQSQAKYEKPKAKTHQNIEETSKNNTFMGFNIDETFPDIINQELSLFLRIIPFKNIEKEVDSSIEFVLAYLDSMSKELKDNEAEVLEAINTPVFLEPLSKLALLQDVSIDVLTKFPTLELILPVELCSELKMMFQSLDVPSRQIYLQMLFDCVNEALNYIRPFGINGIPDPWCNSPRILFGESELENVFNRIIAYLIKWSSCRAGCFHSFESQNDEERLQALREEKMSSLLCLDVRDEEPNWLIYDEEETQVKIITANEILEDLLKETLDFL